MSSVKVLFSFCFGGFIGAMFFPLVSGLLASMLMTEAEIEADHGLAGLPTIPLGGLLGAFSGWAASLWSQGRENSAAWVGFMGGGFVGSICLLFAYFFFVQPQQQPTPSPSEYLCIFGPSLLCSIWLSVWGGQQLRQMGEL